MNFFVEFHETHEDYLELNSGWILEIELNLLENIKFLFKNFLTINIVLCTLEDVFTISASMIVLSSN